MNEPLFKKLETLEILKILLALVIFSGSVFLVSKCESDKGDRLREEIDSLKMSIHRDSEKIDSAEAVILKYQDSLAVTFELIRGYKVDLAKADVRVSQAESKYRNIRFRVSGSDSERDSIWRSLYPSIK